MCASPPDRWDEGKKKSMVKEIPCTSLIGVLLVSVVLSGALWGVFCSQVLYYYIRFPNDPLSIKLLVGAVTVSDTIHQALITHSSVQVYWYLITEYGNQDSLALLVKSVVVEVIFQCITGFLVQGYYTICVWRLSKGKLYLVVPVAAMVFAEFGLSLAYTIIALTRLETFGDLVQIKVRLMIGHSVPDVAIASILCTILYQSRTGSSKSNMLINRLMVFAINTGLLTSICACISLITFFVFPTTFIYICFYFLIGRLYANSLMAMLNARRSRRDGCSSDETTISLREVPTTGSNLTCTHCNVPSSPGGGRIAIRVNTTKEMKHEPIECNTAGSFGPDMV
ncbi:hypothetical protein V8D89_013910 [Ganoderma adspersum]